MARDYRAEYQRRVERAGGASALYRSRLASAEAKVGPSAPRSSLRGHGRETLVSDVSSGRAALVFPVAGERDEATGRYRSLTFVVQDQQGRTQQIRLTGRALTAQRLRQLADAFGASGTAFVPSPSFDVAGLSLADMEAEEEEGWDEE